MPCCDDNDTVCKRCHAPLCIVCSTDDLRLDLIDCNIKIDCYECGRSNALCDFEEDGGRFLTDIMRSLDTEVFMLKGKSDSRVFKTNHEPCVLLFKRHPCENDCYDCDCTWLDLDDLVISPRCSFELVSKTPLYNMVKDYVVANLDDSETRASYDSNDAGIPKNNSERRCAV